MNKFQKLGLAALLSTLLVACGPEAKKEEKAASNEAKPAQVEQAPAPAAQPAQVVDAKAEFQLVANVEQPFASALQESQQQLQNAQNSKDSVQIDAAYNHYFSVIEKIVQAHQSLQLKDPEVSAFNSQIAKVLEESVVLTKMAMHLDGTEAAKEALKQKQDDLSKSLADLQQMEKSVTAKYAQAQ